jgi:DNA modification methylase
MKRASSHQNRESSGTDRSRRRDIKPRSPTTTLSRDYTSEERDQQFDADLVSAVVGMQRPFMARALDGPGAGHATISLGQVLELLDLDAYQETFVPRSRTVAYLQSCTRPPVTALALPAGIGMVEGDARSMIPRIPAGSVQCVVTSSPYWGMRLYEDMVETEWADGESCPYGLEQTPEGFIRHTVELLHLLKPALAGDGSVWWNLGDSYNTRTAIRINARARLEAMGEQPGERTRWGDHSARRYSAGHMYLDDGDQCLIPQRVAERAVRVGYWLKNVITWRKLSTTPEAARSRVTRQSEYVIHLGVGPDPYFDTRELAMHHAALGGRNGGRELAENLTALWELPTATGKNGSGAEFPLALPGRCIQLASRKSDLVLDPFLGSGTTALAALRLGRRCLGFDVSPTYVAAAIRRVSAGRGLWSERCADDAAEMSPR